MRKQKPAAGMAATSRELDRLIEEATVDCHNEEEQATGFLAMIDDNLALPFVTRLLGVEVSVVAVEMDDDCSLKAVCERGSQRQWVGLADLPLPSPPPSGAEWIAAYRRWAGSQWGGRDDEEEE
jgi:Calcium binding